MRARLLAVGALLALAGAPSTAQARGCAHRLPHGPRVPAPIVFRTLCGVFELRRDGSVAYGRLPTDVPRWAPSATSHPDPRTWVAHPHRRLAVYRDGRLLWHSHVTGGSDNVAVGNGHVAFTSFRHWSGPTLWVAPLGGRERKVAAKEDVVGWVAAGLLTQRGADLRLRAPDGRLLRHVVRARTAFMDGSSGIVLRTDGLLVRTDGWHSRRLADLRRLGLSRYPWLERIDGGLWQASAGRRVLFLRHDGRRFGSFSLTQRAGSLAGNVVLLPDRSAVLFVVHRRRTLDEKGALTVYRLDRGASVPQPLFDARVRQLTCGEWGGLEYRGGRVLFSSNNAGIAVLDPSRRAPRIDLTRFARRLVPRGAAPDTEVRVTWAS
jgi:hypothetical protein